jgi:hypothetical protein
MKALLLSKFLDALRIPAMILSLATLYALVSVTVCVVFGLQGLNLYFYATVGTVGGLALTLDVFRQA